MFGYGDADAPESVSPFHHIQGRGIAVAHGGAGERRVAEIETEAEDHRGEVTKWQTSGPVPKLTFEYLARWIAWKRIDENHRFGDLEPGQLLTTVVDEVIGCGRPG